MHAFIQDVPIDDATYWRIVDQLGDRPLEGQLLHLCVRRPDGGLRYIDVWESAELCGRTFDERIHPAVDAAFGGSRPGPEPTVERLEVLHATGSAVPAATEPRWTPGS